MVMATLSLVATSCSVAGPAKAESPTQIGSSTVIASEGPNHSLYIYRQPFGSDTWKKQIVAGMDTTYSSPRVIQVLSHTVIAVEGPTHTLDVYLDNGQADAWRRYVVGGKETTYATPGIALSKAVGGTKKTGTDIAVVGPHNTLNVYWNIAGTSKWSEHAIAGKGTTFSAAAIVQDNGPAMNVTAEGPNHSLDFYWSSDNVKWTAAPVSHSAGTVYSAPAIAVSKNVAGTGALGTYVAFEGPGNILRAHWNVAGKAASGWQTVAGKHTTYSAPSAANIIGAVNIVAEGPGHALNTYWTDSNTWHPNSFARGGVYAAPTITQTSNAGGSGKYGLEIVAEGPGHSLYDYWNISGVGGTTREQVAGAGWSFA
jgi:hypothetical protein